MAMLVLLTASVCSFAQSRKITGTVTDRDTKEAVMQATVQLLKTDSTFITGVLTDENGVFSVEAPQDGKYLVKLTSVGYKPIVRTVTVSGGRDVALGNIVFGADAIMLKGATVVGQAAKVTLKEDTFVYNASAYRTPEGSVIEELVKKLPGAQVDDDGKITINGKEVKKILVDGKEFMTGDTKTAMKNLPTSIIEKVKAYDEKSDLARITGIDDGEEQTVLDFGIKKGMNKGTLANADLGIGTKGRYAERVMGGYFRDNMKLMVFGNANNTNDHGFPGGGGGGRFGAARQGLNAAKMLGVNMNYSSRDKFEMNGSVRWNHSNGDMRSEQSAENFLGNSTSSFLNSRNNNLTRTDSWNANFRLEWKPDTMTNILFRPQFSYSANDGRQQGNSASYNTDPYLYVSDPLSDEAITQMAADGRMINTRRNSSISYTDSKRVGGMLQLNRKLSSKGRNVTLRTDMSYSTNGSENLSLSDVRLYQVQNALGNDSTYQTYRYNTTPAKTWSYSLQATYSEPIFRAMFLQFSYKFTYNYNKSDRSTYDFSGVDSGLFGSVMPEYRGWNSYFSLLENPLDSYRDSGLSRYSEYRNYIQEAQLMLRIIRSKYQFNVGMMVQPQKTKFVQHYQGINVDTTRTVTNVTPTLDFRYRFSKISNLRINYRGTTAQPSMTDLLDITDDSDPLNITTGNPGLKPSFTNSFRLFYNTYIEKRQQGIMTFVNYSNTRNAISNMVTYDETTGGRITRPENINGNWNAYMGVMYSTAVDSAGFWNINTFTNAGYNNYVGYLSQDRMSSQKNTTRTTSVSERLQGSYRNSWVEVSLDGSFNYAHTRNLLQSQNNMDTWQFAYGGSLNFYLPWGTSIATDMHNNCRRGYNDSSMNTNELVWNAQVSHGFLKGKALTVSLQFYDILHRQSNFSRTVSAMQRSDTSYNSINSYAMLHAIYRINLFGGKDARQGMRGRGGDRQGSRRPPMVGSFRVPR